jgi:dCMP deaminase
VKQKFKNLYMQMAETVSTMSHAVRKKVGCIIVSPQDLLCIGYNGMPSGWDNNCEWMQPTGADGSLVPTHQLATLKEVLHAESNALMKAAREGFSLKGSSMFVTCSPCLECAKLIHQAGIKEIYYKEVYRSTDGINFLTKCGIDVKQI